VIYCEPKVPHFHKHWLIKQRNGWFTDGTSATLACALTSCFTCPANLPKVSASGWVKKLLRRILGGLGARLVGLVGSGVGGKGKGEGRRGKGDELVMLGMLNGVMCHNIPVFGSSLSTTFKFICILCMQSVL